MCSLELKLQVGPNPTSVRVRIKNLAGVSVSVTAPNPYQSVWVFDNDHQPLPRVRAVAWKHSRKTSQIRPNEEIVVTIDLLHYWDEVYGDAFVQVRLEVTGDSGVPQEHDVVGKVLLNIPSYQEKYEEMKRNRPPQGIPLKIFDVSDSTQFEKISQDTSGPCRINGAAC